MSSRDARIDLLRTVGLLLIVLAHVGAPAWLWQLRNFDVPLMVMVAGLAYAQSPSVPYGAYVWKRVLRLAVPGWIFSVVYFTWLYAVDWPVAFTWIELRDSLLLSSGYTWMLGVLLMVALLAPLCQWLDQVVRGRDPWLNVIGAGLILSELVRWCVVGTPLVGLGYVLPYAVLFMLGLSLPSLPRLSVLGLIGISTFMVLGLGVREFVSTGQFVYTQAFKYPPGLYYLAYALVGSGLCWLAAPRITAWLHAQGWEPAVKWISVHSLAIFLWHQPLADALHLPWYANYPVILLGAVGLTWIQELVVRAWTMTIRRPVEETT